MKVEQSRQVGEGTEDTGSNARRREAEERVWQRNYVEELRGDRSGSRPQRSIEQLGLPLAEERGRAGSVGSVVLRTP